MAVKKLEKVKIKRNSTLLVLFAGQEYHDL